VIRITLLLITMLVSACANSDFSGAAGNRSKADAGDDDEEQDTDAGEADGPDGGDTDGGPDSGESDSDEDSGKAEGGIDSDSDNAKEGGISVDEEIAKLPGVEVVKVGVNFEDMGLSGDRDHNDAVLCFDGHFKVDATPGNVVSIKEQVVTGRTFSSSGCKHNVKVEIVHKDGTKEAPITFASNSGQQVTMNFKKGSKLEVYMTATDGCSPGVEKNMHTNVDCKVEPDVCRDSGG
jgi:hypothetical protein